MSDHEKELGEALPVNMAVRQLDGAGSPTQPATIDPAAEKRLVRKLDLCVYPILYIVYMMSFLDRINISNARIQGMTKDLDLTGNRFNIALFVSCLLSPGRAVRVLC